MLEEILKELVEAVNANTSAMVVRNKIMSDMEIVTHSVGDVSKTTLTTAQVPETPPRKKRRTKKQIAEDEAKQIAGLPDTCTPPPPATPSSPVAEVAAMGEDELVGGSHSHAHPPSAAISMSTIETIREFAIDAGLKKGALKVTEIIALYGENIDAIKPEHYERFMFDVADLPDIGATPPPPGPQA